MSSSPEIPVPAPAPGPTPRPWMQYLHAIRFTPALENSFSTQRHRQTRMRRPQLALTAFVYLVLFASQALTSRSTVFRTTLFFLGSLVPLAIYAGTRLHFGRKVSRYREIAWALSLFLIALVSLRLDQLESTGALACSQVSLLAILAIACLIVRLPFRISAFGTAIISLLDVEMLLTRRQLSASERVADLLSIVALAAVILATNYSSELQARLTFLRHVRNHRRAELLAAANSELRRRSRRDALTGLNNRAAFDSHFRRLWTESVRNGKPIAAVLIDVDHFKIVNDTQGHLFGDEVLKRVGALLLQSMRGKRDFVARYGGEEFVILLPDTTAKAAAIVAERIRSLVQIAGSPAPQDETTSLRGLYTTVSCGVASLRATPAIAPSELIARADRALYVAKSSGRNRVSTDTPVSEESETIATGWS